MKKALFALADLPRWFWLTTVTSVFAGCTATANDLSAFGANAPGLIAALVAVIQVYKEKSKVAQMLAAAQVAQQDIQNQQEKAILDALALRNAEVAELRALVEGAVSREHKCIEQLTALQQEFKAMHKGMA